MDTMATYLDQAEKSARYLLQVVDKSSGTCESCGAESATIYYLGTAFECGDCFHASVTYWEQREGTTTEAIWDGDPFPMEWTYGGAEHRAVVARHHSTLAELLRGSDR